jgi:hypothetical protein
MVRWALRVLPLVTFAQKLANNLSTQVGGQDRRQYSTTRLAIGQRYWHNELAFNGCQLPSVKEELPLI